MNLLNEWCTGPYNIISYIFFHRATNNNEQNAENYIFRTEKKADKWSVFFFCSQFSKIIVCYTCIDLIFSRTIILMHSLFLSLSASLSVCVCLSLSHALASINMIIILLRALWNTKTINLNLKSGQKLKKKCDHLLLAHAFDGCNSYPCMCVRASDNVQHIICLWYNFIRTMFFFFCIFCENMLL